MREIKFRAWHPQNKCMVVFDNVKAARDVEMSRQMLLLMADKHSNGKGLMMQYTGLKDKNGVEIYEGDITDDHVGIGVVTYSDKHAAFRVVYAEGIAKWFIDYSLAGERASIKVIGNIHENPELLGE